MKPIFKINPVLWIFILFVQSSYGQFLSTDTVPLDPRVKTGALANGLQYYIQHNPKPENKLELRLVVNAGSILEDDDQLGLAHFTEHMAFNGSEHFEKNDLISYLQSIGVSFGRDLNAYTSFDETVYILPIPTDDEEKLKNGFLVLKDWAGGMLLEEEDIDAERSIIVEEWRTGQGTDQRMRDQYLPVLFHESKYADRLPIGKMDIIENADYEALRRFYRDWYRPDNMAVIAVGNVDPDRLESLIEEYFAHLTNPSDPRKREEFPVPPHKESLVKIVTDSEAPGIQVQLYYKHLPKETITFEDYKNRLLRTIYGGLLSQRLDEIRQKQDAPFIFAGARYGNFVRGLDFFSTSGVVPTGKTEVGLEAFIRENERALRFGFTQQELDRVIRSLTNSAERSYKEMDKMESGSLVSRYVSHYLKGNFAEGEELRHRLYQEILPAISLEEVNNLGKELVTEENRVIIVTAPESEQASLPDEEKLLALFETVRKSPLEAYEEKLLAEHLIDELPTPGRVVKQDKEESVDVTSLIFSNGARVFVKPTTFKNDEILFTARGEGGTSLYPDEDLYAANYAGVMVNIMGVADFPPSDLRKILSGKNVIVTPNISTYSQDIAGSTSPRDLEQTLQLIHLYFTSPRKDEELFEVYIQNQKTQISSAMANPDFQFSRKVNEIVSNGNKRALGIYEPEEFDKIDLDRGLEIYRDRFGNVANFDFLFTGNIDLESAIPLLEKYIGSLPGNPDQKDRFVDLNIRPPRGASKSIEVGKDDKSQVILYFSGEESYGLEKSQQISYLGEILTIKLIETLREEIGGVYGVGASGSLSTVPEERFAFSVSFPCGPDKVEELIDAAWKEIRKIQENGPLPEDVEKVRETKRVALEENLKRNYFWSGQLSAAINRGMPLSTILGAMDRINAVSAEQVQEAAKKYLREENLLEIKRFPANYQKTED